MGVCSASFDHQAAQGLLQGLAQQAWQTGRRRARRFFLRRRGIARAFGLSPAFGGRLGKTLLRVSEVHPRSRGGVRGRRGFGQELDGSLQRQRKVPRTSRTFSALQKRGRLFIIFIAGALRVWLAVQILRPLKNDRFGYLFSTPVLESTELPPEVKRSYAAVIARPRDYRTIWVR